MMIDDEDISNTPPIMFFRGEHEFLSNFYICPMVYKDLSFASVEHAFVYEKTACPKLKELCLNPAISPGVVKIKGREVKTSSGWDLRKLDVMRQLLIIKFNIPELRDLLLDTKDAVLYEGNTWGDTFWGVTYKDGNITGTNHLGRLIMDMRNMICQ